MTVEHYQPIRHGLPTDTTIKHVVATGLFTTQPVRYDAWFEDGEWSFVEDRLGDYHTVTHWKDREEVPD